MSATVLVDIDPEHLPQGAAGVYLAAILKAHCATKGGMPEGLPDVLDSLGADEIADHHSAFARAMFTRDSAGWMKQLQAVSERGEQQVAWAAMRWFDAFYQSGRAAILKATRH